MINHFAAVALGVALKPYCLGDTSVFSAIEMLHDIALYIFNIDIDIDIDIVTAIFRMLAVPFGGYRRLSVHSRSC